MYQQLQPQLEKYLPEAKNVYIATALIKNYGYDFLEKRIPADAKRHYLIGLNLPSDAAVFRKMLGVPESKGTTKIYAENKTFHPKVYLIERRSGEWIGFIGSANTTNGGLIGNVEMTLATEDETTCRSLLQWFNDLSADAGELTEKFVNAWQRTSTEVRKREYANKSDIDDVRSFLKKPPIKKSVAVPSVGQFFDASHYQAYASVNWTVRSPAAIAERRKVWFRLAELDKRIYPQFKDFRLDELGTHYWSQNRISLYQYKQGFNNPSQESIWLHYGYPNRNKEKDFTEHPRMQVILHQADIGIWLVVGTEGYSVTERIRFKESLRNDPFFADLVFKLAADLGTDYWLGMNGKPVCSLRNFTKPEDLKTALLSEDPNHYLIFGRTFQPDHPLIADAAIAETVLFEFQRLYPLYLLFKNGKL